MSKFKLQNKQVDGRWPMADGPRKKTIDYRLLVIEPCILVFILYTLSFVFLSGCTQLLLYKSKQLMMGTFVEVTSPDERAAGIAFAEIKRIEGLLSKYAPDSEVSMLNREGQLKVSPETLFVVRKAGEFWKASEGVFDITVEPLVDLWGFKDKNYRVPSGEEIKAVLGKIGFDKLQISDSIIKFTTDGVRIDLGGIAKGYAVDCAVKKLKQAGIKNALINAGGDIYCLGDRMGHPWRIAVQNPWKAGFITYLEIKDKAVATSGNYEQYFVRDGIRYSHIIHPRTGRPADSGVSSVTVIANDCLTADALATSIFILGKEKGDKLARWFNAQAMVY